MLDFFNNEMKDSESEEREQLNQWLCSVENSHTKT